MRIFPCLSLIAALVFVAVMPAGAQNQGPLDAARSAARLAQFEPVRSTIAGDANQTRIHLGISESVPYRAFLLDAPPRLVVDFQEVDFADAKPEAFLGAGAITALRWGPFRTGWSRMVAELSGPVRIERAVMQTSGAPALDISLVPVPEEEFAPHPGSAESALWDLPQPARVAQPINRQDGTRNVVVALDPGHGGRDPGAEAGPTTEAIVVLTFARELKERLSRAGIEIVMTREDNRFVSLEDRLTRARSAGADLFISLHADALENSTQTGAAVYVFDPDATRSATQKLTERHGRGDLLSGVDMIGQGDDVAVALMQMARRETAPRSLAFAQNLGNAISRAGLTLYKPDVQFADFSVLKAADIPSVLIELGFLSSDGDRKRLLDPRWRARMAEAVTGAVETWARADAAQAPLLRQ
ncbi:AMIN domain-containing protein [Rhodobacteraceae bacterium]|nr:AMIN domain-containing protein [Paracoccaceae bacterium]